jgi:hypothetical protein
MNRGSGCPPAVLKYVCKILSRQTRTEVFTRSWGWLLAKPIPLHLSLFISYRIQPPLGPALLIFLSLFLYWGIGNNDASRLDGRSEFASQSSGNPRFIATDFEQCNKSSAGRSSILYLKIMTILSAKSRLLLQSIALLNRENIYCRFGGAIGAATHPGYKIDPLHYIARRQTWIRHQTFGNPPT